MNTQLTLAESARTLVQQAARATLSTLCKTSGTPYGSMVEVAPSDDGSILMLLSKLAEHRQFLDADARASLLIAPDLHSDNALAKPRVSLMGQANQVDVSDAERDAYLNRHPAAEMYLSLGDFHFYQLQVTRVRYIAGFGKMGWLSEEDYRSAQPDVLWEIGPGAIEHMNDDHSDALLSYVHVLADRPWAQSAVLVNMDRYGMDIEASGDDQSESVRVVFDPPLVNPAELRPRVVQMAQQSRN